MPTRPKALENAVDDVFETTEVETRAGVFKIRELSAEEYDSAYKASTDADGDLDTVALLRWMTIKSVYEPRLTIDELVKLPMGVVGRIGKAVNDLHFPVAANVKPATEGDEGERPNS